MKKLILTFSLLTSAYLSAQGHFKGSSALELGGGLTRYGFYGTINYDKYLHNKWFLKGGITAEKGKLVNLNFARYYAHAGLYYNVYTLNDILMVDLGLGPVGRMDNITAFENKIKQTSFNFGGFGALETEVKVYQKLSAVLEFRQSFYAKPVFANRIFFVGLGLKYNF